jgi:hypothetical protein
LRNAATPAKPHRMTLLKVILITLLVFAGLNLFLYGRYKRMMVEIRRLAEEQKAKEQRPGQLAEQDKQDEDSKA